MRWWPLFGLSRRLTEKNAYQSDVDATPLPRLFRRSLFVYAIDAGNSNALNVEIAALRSPQYNIHRFGIFFADAPRHADLLLVLGRPTRQTLAPVEETIAQLPRPFGIVHIYEPITVSDQFVDLELPNLLARVEGRPGAAQLLGLLLKVAKGGSR